MVDFTRERPIDVQALAVLVNVNQITIRRWFKRGLEFCKLGGKVVTSLEALNRFQRDGQSSPMLQAVVVDSETLAALKQLRSRGIVFGTDSSNGNKSARQMSA